MNSAADTLVQATICYASGVPMVESKGISYQYYNVYGVQPNQNFGRDEQPYLYNGKEFVEAHGLNEYDSQARMYYATIMRTTTMDPRAEDYYHLSPYSWCGNNPVNAIDLNGMDTIDVTYNTETEHWDLGDPIISEGDDVINVIDKDGNTSSYEFSEGEYGNRICSIRLESTDQQTFGMFYLSGAGFAGYSVEPAGEPNNEVQDKQPIVAGVYNIDRGNGNRWTGWPRQYSTSESNFLSSDRAVCIHYIGNHDGKFMLKDESLRAVRWSTKCMVVATDYTLGSHNGVPGYVYYNSINSFKTAIIIAKYAGATGRKVRTSSNGKGNYYICTSTADGYKNRGTIRIVK